jgi:hypothetical protein
VPIASQLMIRRYIQMSGMALGSVLEADHRMRRFQDRVKADRRRARDMAREAQLDADLLKQARKDLE